MSRYNVPDWFIKKLRLQLLTAVIVIVGGLSLQSCSAVDVAKFFTGATSKGLSVDAQIGDKKAEISGQKGTGDIKVKDNGTVSVNTSKTDSNIERAEEVTINNTIPPWIMVLLLAGWILPQPSTMWINVKNYYKRLRNVK